jgi:flagellar biosynthesis protein FlhB
MAADSHLEKTEPASQRRLEKAREEGQIARSQELNTCAVLFGSGVLLYASASTLMRDARQLLAGGLTLTREQMLDAHQLLPALFQLAWQALTALSPLLILVVVVVVVSQTGMGGWVFSTKPFMPQFSRLSPMAGFGRMFSTHSLVELGKALLKTILVAAVVGVAIWQERNTLLALLTMSLPEGVASVGRLLGVTFLAGAGSLVLVAAIDVPFQLWQHHHRLRMTKEEVRQEMKETEGDPHIKARIRQQQREMARRRMMAAVPTADVVVTNPTHYAVALKYESSGGRAPRVVAKGADAVAAKIRELAQEHRVPLLEAPPLARALYKHTNLGDEIPALLYKAVAEILAYVFQLRSYRPGSGNAPRAPRDLPVPPELDVPLAAQQEAE